MQWIKDLKRFERIAVTGPQRSGTTIAAKIIASETGHKYIDENDFSINSFDRFKEIFKQSNIVVQCPGVCRWAHEIGAIEGAAVVMMTRSVEDIIASQNRIRWEGEGIELKKYGTQSGPVAQVKYDFWKEYQRGRIRQPIELEYESLSYHPLWVPKDKRRNFKTRQTA